MDIDKFINDTKQQIFKIREIYQRERNKNWWLFVRPLSLKEFGMFGIMLWQDKIDNLNWCFTMREYDNFKWLFPEYEETNYWKLFLKQENRLKRFNVRTAKNADRLVFIVNLNFDFLYDIFWRRFDKFIQEFGSPWPAGGKEICSMTTWLFWVWANKGSKVLRQKMRAVGCPAEIQEFFIRKKSHFYWRKWIITIKERTRKLSKRAKKFRVKVRHDNMKNRVLKNNNNVLPAEQDKRKMIGVSANERVVKTNS